MSYWNSKNMSIKGRVKVLNIFILSKLWYILESQDIPLNLMKDLNTLIKNFTWKGAPQVQFNSLHDRYEEGGLNLQDIFLKKQALRLKWLRDLVLSEDDSIEKFKARLVADGNSQKEGQAFDAVFAPVVRMSSVRILLVLAAAHDWGLWQLLIILPFPRLLPFLPLCIGPSLRSLLLLIALPDWQ